MILPPATLGMLGGGQLGRFFVSAAHEMGYKVWVLDPDPNSPAGKIADRHLASAYDDPAALAALAAECAVVTTEFENVPATTLERLAQSVPVHPAAGAVAVCQDRIAEKNFLANHGFPHGPFIAVRRIEDLQQADAKLFPAILKVARFGYDGKGQARVADRAEAMSAFAQFGHEACVLEKMLALDCEISVVLARDANGAMRSYEPGENSHRNGILDVTVSPARVAETLRGEARQIACRIAEALGYIGTLGVEFFISGGRLIVNEMAPRPHNSGHHTIDACAISQYDQQVRAITGMPLGEPEQHSPAVMVNLLGELWFDATTGQYREPDWPSLHVVPGLRLHLYGKHEARAGRKMGHFTVIGRNAETVLQHALQARQAIGIGSRHDNGDAR